MKAIAKLLEQRRCDTDLPPFLTRAICVLFPLALVLVCAAQRNDSHAPSTLAGQNIEPRRASASASEIRTPCTDVRRSEATPHQPVSPVPSSANNSGTEPEPSSPQPVAPSPPASAATPAIPLPETVHNAAPGQNEPPSPQLKTDLSSPLSAPPDSAGTGQPHLGQVPFEPPPALEAPGGVPGSNMPANDDPLTPVAPGFPEPGSPSLNSVPDANAAESDLDRTWRLSIQLALHDTNVAHLVVEEARSDRIPNVAWLSILAALLGQSVTNGAPPATGPSASGSLTAEDLLARIDLAEQLALVVPKAATREALEEICLLLARQFRK
jgi:hypothetical protein